MGFVDAIKTCFHKYLTVQGRASRSEFWWFALFSFIMFIIPFVNFVAFFVLLIPMITVSVRRLHDRGFTGWLLLAPTAIGIAAFGIGYLSGSATLYSILSAISSIASIAIFVLEVLPSVPGDNKYGSCPIATKAE